MYLGLQLFFFQHCIFELSTLTHRHMITQLSCSVILHYMDILQLIFPFHQWVVMQVVVSILLLQKVDVSVLASLYMCESFCVVFLLSTLFCSHFGTHHFNSPTCLCVYTHPPHQTMSSIRVGSVSFTPIHIAPSSGPGTQQVLG